jgi:hypothetical protein
VALGGFGSGFCILHFAFDIPWPWGLGALGHKLTKAVESALAAKAKK